MANLSNLKPTPGARKRKRRVGCGVGSGRGKTSTRGHKGQRSRSGDGKQVGFEGGQMPLLRRSPKVGFNNIFRKAFQPVNLGEIGAAFEGAKGTITVAQLRERGLAKGRLPVKVLGSGELKSALSVEAHSFSASAKAKIEKAGGKAEVVSAKERKSAKAA